MIVEAFNQIGRRDRERFFTADDRGEQTEGAVRSLLGHRRSQVRIRRSEPLLDRT